MGATARGEGERRRARWWGLAAAATVVAVLLVPLLADPRLYFRGDTPGAYYGWWFHLGQELRAGRWPVLDPHAWRAGNLVAEGQWGLFSPAVWLLALATTVTGSVLALATTVKVVLALTGSLGVFALARSYAVPPAGAYLAAVAVPLGGMTQYLDLPSWSAALMIWALVPWVWWSLRRFTGLAAAGPRGGPAAPLALAYLLVTVGYVYGTIMLALVLGVCLLDVLVGRTGDGRTGGGRGGVRRLVGVGVLSGLVAVAVYLPGVLTIGVTIRGTAYAATDKFSTDFGAMLTSVLPTAAVHGTTLHLIPYAYAVWFLPALLLVDLRRVREGWRPVAGLLALTVVLLAVVLGPQTVGPLRWPLRMQPFLVQALVLLTVVTVSRYAARASLRRLVPALAWVAAAALVAVDRAPSMTDWHLLAAALVAAGVAGGWVAARRRAVAVAVLVATVTTVALAAVQDLAYPEPPSPQRPLPAHLAGYREPLQEAEGDVVVVGDGVRVVEDDPDAAADLLIGSAWYLNGHRVQNTYTTISFQAFYDRYCMRFDGHTCPEALATLFSVEPTTGLPRVDLLGVSTVVLVRADFPVLPAVPPGWRAAATSAYTVTWVRDDPVPGAGGVVWSSPGTAVTVEAQDDRSVELRVDAVAASGGRVVLSRLPWPGYAVDGGAIEEPADGYLLTVAVPADSAGEVVTVRFDPPGWPVEVACWAVAVLAGTGWVLVAARQRRTNPH